MPVSPGRGHRCVTVPEQLGPRTGETQGLGKGRPDGIVDHMAV